MIAAFVSFDKVKGLERKTRAERKIDRMKMLHLAKNFIYKKFPYKFLEFLKFSEFLWIF